MAGKSRAFYFNLVPNTAMQISRIEMIANPISSGVSIMPLVPFFAGSLGWRYRDRIAELGPQLFRFF
jgi:hypothetical protein